MWDKVVDIHQCHLQAEPANEIRNAVKTFALKHQLDFFNPEIKKAFTELDDTKHQGWGVYGFDSVFQRK